jgi:DNA-directed RNA polymerase specialized sigma24 family protein
MEHTVVTMTVVGSDTFTDFFKEAEPRLRRALTAAIGSQAARDAAAAALAYGWEHWDRVSGMENPIGYLYRVGRSKARVRRKRLPVLVGPGPRSEPWFEPGLDTALRDLTERQRIAVMLVHGFDYTPTEAGQVLGVSAGSAHRHATRGLDKLRRLLEVDR